MWLASPRFRMMATISATQHGSALRRGVGGVSRDWLPAVAPVALPPDGSRRVLAVMRDLYRTGSGIQESVDSTARFAITGTPVNSVVPSPQIVTVRDARIKNAPCWKCKDLLVTNVPSPGPRTWGPGWWPRNKAFLTASESDQTH